MTAPALVVQVGDPGVDTPTSAAAVTWQTITTDLELTESPVEIGWGRSDEIAQPDPNTCSLILAASEFRQDADGPYAVLADTSAELVIGQALRARGQASGYTARNRFHGFVSGITPLWPDGDVDHLRVQVTAMSRLAWLGRAQNLQDRTSAAVLAAGATSYWPMSEVITDENNISDPSPPWFEFDEQPNIQAMGNNPAGLSAAFGWEAGTAAGWGPSPDGLKVANFEIAPQPGAGTPKIDAAQVAPMPKLGATEPWSVCMIGRSGRGKLTESRKFIVFALRGRDDLGFYTAQNSNGYIQAAWFATSDSPYWSITAYDSAGGFIDVSIGETDGAVRDKRWHLYTMVSTGGATPTLKVYRDTALMTSLPIGSGLLSDFNSISVGNMSYVPEDTEANDPRHEFGRLAIFAGTALSAGDISDLYDNILTATLGEADTVAERLERWFTYAGFDASQLTVTSPGSTPLTVQDVNGASPLSLLQDVASTDGGVLYDGRSTDTTYLGRSVRLAAVTGVTLDVAAQEVAASLSTPVDLQDLVNSVTARAANDSATVTRTDGPSVDRFGYSGEEQNMLTGSLPHLIARADWRLHTSSRPHPRAPSLELELAGLSDIQQDNVLGIDMWDVIALAGLPTEVDGVPATYFAEGGTESWGHQSCVFTFNVTDAAPESEVGIYDDEVRGLWDSAVFG